MAQMMMMAGGGLQAIGEINQSQAQASAMEYNAGQMNTQATLEDIKAQDDARRQQIQAKQQIGDMRANVGASGLQLDGSALDLLGYSAKNAELDRQNIIYGGQNRSGALRNQAQLLTFGAHNARVQGYMSAASSLVGSGAKSASMSRA